MTDRSKITGIILAGGKSTRMGTDKGLMLRKGKTFIEHVIQALNPLVGDILIVSNNPDYDRFNVTRIEDIIEDAGPLAGLYSGLNHSKTDYNLVLSCDVPLITTKILELLIDEMNLTNDVIQFESRGKTMPLTALYHKRCAGKCIELLDQGERRLRTAVTEMNTKTIKLDAGLEHFLTNINTPEQLKELNHATAD